MCRFLRQSVLHFARDILKASALHRSRLWWNVDLRHLITHHHYKQQAPQQQHTAAAAAAATTAISTTSTAQLLQLLQQLHCKSCYKYDNSNYYDRKG
eukprot:2737641-Amphidinium_carterae.1